MVHKKNAQRALVGRAEGNKRLGTLKCILRKRMGRLGLDSSGPAQGPVADTSEHGNEPGVKQNAGNLFIH
jgi:hypothetical protein